MDWQYFFDKEKDGFYTQILMHLLSLVVIILYFSVNPKTKSLVYLVIITIASFIEGITGDLTNLIHKPVIIAIGSIVAGIYLLIEIIYCLLFIKSHIQSRRAKKIISIGPFIPICYFFATIIIFASRHHSVTNQTNAVTFISFTYIIEGFLIIICCLYFFYELLIHDPIKGKLSLPAIWAVSGMLILSGTITPFFLFISYLTKNNRPLMHSLWTINYIAYSLLFIAFIMAIRSDKRESIKTINNHA